MFWDDSGVSNIDPLTARRLSKEGVDMMFLHHWQYIAFAFENSALSREIDSKRAKGWVAQPGPALPLTTCLQCFQHANNEGRLSHRRRVAPWLRVASPSISVALAPHKCQKIIFRLYWLNKVWTILFNMQIHLALNIYIPTGSMLTCTMLNGLIAGLISLPGIPYSSLFILALLHLTGKTPLNIKKKSSTPRH